MDDTRAALSKTNEATMVISSDDPNPQDPDKWGFVNLEEEIRYPDSTRPPSAREIEYLINRYPFLSIFDAQADFSQIEELPSPRLIKADTGWLIQDYGFYMSSSLGELLYGDY